MRLIFHPKFRKFAEKLPLILKEKLSELMEVLQDDPFSPLLHTKKLTGKLAGLHSFRITRDWRVVFKFIDQETIQLLRIDNRKDVYR